MDETSVYVFAYRVGHVTRSRPVRWSHHISGHRKTAFTNTITQKQRDLLIRLLQLIFLFYTDRHNYFRHVGYVLRSAFVYLSVSRITQKHRERILMNSF